ncbi:NAD(P)H-quinone oxidoreductase subunit S, chloroplastic [Magnolia sinica]|uniref:NAD(P)H-quinone oxidoreductase subunit S, chloroplastic n=1 Tax=Magnolia sinica TaxID=86752 RepID=UPI0026598086|nr:NAD(P)H-quinone oxidoreductase subunit S, chloroplastic [Magnolia sinica]XP_058083335.1 NAD(P)H-quinone oxidoreductase subunit S, chloroplastic [Magnolia sinica]XP_058083336.1 NAD(P)H-quinone oxidoreductase subunit S, chloroplastic [Magnolia sinica]
MASSPFILPSLQSAPSLQKSTFLGNPTPVRLFFKSPHKPTASLPLKPSAKFNLFELLGGRGLCSGEEGLEQELKKTVDSPPTSSTEQEKPGTLPSSNLSPLDVDEDAFEKELLGLTGGFPGGEKGLNRFIEENPPPKKIDSSGEMGVGFSSSKPKPPELPLLMPGMIVIVKNPDNPFHMYCGIIQRITDGKAGVLFEGGNWDKLITFRLDELERREKGPPMVNPKSASLETLFEK